MPPRFCISCARKPAVPGTSRCHDCMEGKPMAWCVVPGCPNFSLIGDRCSKHELDQSVKASHERKETDVKVKVADGYQLVDMNGKVVTSGGTAEVDTDTGKAAIMNGWATEAKAAPKPAAQKPTAQKSAAKKK